MWVLKTSKAAERRKDNLFATEKFDYNEFSRSLNNPEDRVKFGYNYLEWEPEEAS